MADEKWKSLDSLLRLRLAELPWELFERFFLDYLNANLSFTISRDGRAVTKRIISAEMYASGSGRKQRGIDLRLVVEGREVWVVQCKRVKKWTVQETKDAIKAAAAYPANHYFLAVACETDHKVHDEIANHPQWTLWNLDTICSDFRRLVPPSKRRDILTFLAPDEVRRFLPFTTDALITPERFFERFMGHDKPLRHDWPIVGREAELSRMGAWADGTQKILLLTSRGGEGKTRLVREFSSILNQADPAAEILFLNPHREDQDSDFSFGLSDDISRRIVVVDDAHRADLVPTSLLNLVRQDPKAKLILAARPQGQDSIASKLIEVGISSSEIQGLSLAPLKKSSARSLAKEILGEPLKTHLGKFLTLTEGNPFLITTAGGLIRQHRLKWGSWSSDKDFRRRVFEEFQNENLASIPENERNQAARLLRLLAILSPVAFNADFVERAASLINGALSIEQLLNFLRQVELLIGREEALRVSPDLFADFLVYETCFDPEKREPVWAKRVMELFSHQGAALIRNISEASWIARLNGVNDQKMLEPLMAWQRERFLKESFIAREATLRYWGSFSQYLPKESMELAELAIKETSAPPDSSPFAMTASFDNHAYVLKQIPGLLRPVAKYHLEYNHKALDILWRLGCGEAQPENNNRSHPWTVIAEVFKFEMPKPVEYNLSALAWLDALIKKPETMTELVKPTPVLRLFLEPCFSRLVDGSYIEGRTIHFVEREVRISSTQVVRDRALSILDWIIEHGSTLAVLDALSALEIAIQRAGLTSMRGRKNLAAFISQWRPERLKALALYRKALEKHPSVVVRYEIRRTLKRDVIYEEDANFADECRRILASIPEDLAFRTAVALTPDFGFEFEETFQNKNDPDRFNKNREMWDQRVTSVANEIAEQYPEAAELFVFLDSVVAELVAGGYSLGQYRLLMALGQTHAELALKLADQIVSAKTKTTLAQDWPALINNEGVDSSQKLDLFEKAVNEKVPGASVAVIRQLASEAQQERVLDQRTQDLLFNIAPRAQEQEAFYLFQLIEHSSEANLSWTFSLLKVLTSKGLSPSLLGACLTALAPYQGRKLNPPGELVHHVFERMISIPDLGFFQHGHVWQVLKAMYPLEVYKLLRERVLVAASRQDWEYTAIPHAVEGRVRLPGLVLEPTTGAIMDELWNRVTSSQEEASLLWIPLFQAVAFEEQGLWYDRIVNALNAASCKEELSRLVQLLSFEGSLIIFEYPEIVEAFLRQATAVGGQELFETIRANLYVGTGPRARGYTGGELDKEYDYIEAAALKAAEKHAASDVLGPFYRWIVEAEQQDRLTHKLRAEQDMADY